MWSQPQIQYDDTYCVSLCLFAFLISDFTFVKCPSIALLPVTHRKMNPVLIIKIKKDIYTADSAAVVILHFNWEQLYFLGTVPIN